jgi:hypothetical protein
VSKTNRQSHTVVITEVCVYYLGINLPSGILLVLSISSYLTICGLNSNHGGDAGLCCSGNGEDIDLDQGALFQALLPFRCATPYLNGNRRFGVGHFHVRKSVIRVGGEVVVGWHTPSKIGRGALT